GDFVVVSTREDLLAEALELIQGNSTVRPVTQDKWYDDAVRAMGDDARNPVAFRLIMDLPAVIKTPYFRSYWIQRNAADLRSYSAFLSQLDRRTNEFEEKRVLVRSEETPVVAHEQSSTDLQRF